METSVDNCDFRIATKNDKQLLISFIKEYYFTENPFSEALTCLGGGFANIPIIDEWFMDNIDQELSIVAVTENNKIVGFIHNVEMKPNCVNMETDYSRINLSSDKKQLMDLVKHVEAQINLLGKNSNVIHKEIEVQTMTMHRDWKTIKLGKLLLDRTISMARQREFTRIRAICTSAYSSKLFSSCGFDCVYSVKYEDFKKVGRINFLPEPPHTHAKAMILEL